MFNIFKKKAPAGETATFKISGMHCTSCSMNIDGELEDTYGVVSADTSYVDAKTKVVFDSKKISQAEIKKAIEGTGYGVVG